MSKGVLMALPSRLALVLALPLVCWIKGGAGGSTAWVGDLKEEIAFECDYGAHISYVKSQHWDSDEDRKWAYECTQGNFVTGECKWTDYTSHLVNWSGDGHCQFDDEWGIITGVDSFWLTDDRRWKYKCCQTKVELENCYWTPFLNDYDEEMEISVSFGKAITSFHSKYDSGKGDRIYKLRICEVKHCEADSIELLDSVEAEEQETAVVGVTTATGCNPDITYYLGLGHETTATESLHFGESSSTSVNWAVSASVSWGVDVKAFNTGFELEVEHTVEAAGEHSWGIEEMSGTETTTGAYAHQYMKFTGPAAALMFAVTKKYKYAASGVSAKYTGTCYTYDSEGNLSEGSAYEKTGTLQINGDTYGMTHYVTRLSHNYDGTNCGSYANLRGCVRDLNADDVLDATNLLNNFEACITAQGGESVRSLTYTKTGNTPWELGSPVNSDYTEERMFGNKTKMVLKKLRPVTTRMPKA